MKKFSLRLMALVLIAVLLLGLGAAALAAAPAQGEKTLTILFTHDTHDHFEPDAADVGGYTRLATLLDRERAAATSPVVTLDGGDFSMGSPFQSVYATDAPELRALGAMGYDVTTFGNHEYDYRPQGLANMLQAAKASGEKLPYIVQANYNTPKDPSAQVAVDAMRDFPVTDYVVLERDGLRVAVFGVLGVDADDCAPMSGMNLVPIVDAAKRVVADIKAKEAPDFIICLSHSGTDNGKGEDYELGKAVDGIDLIISGHTHSTTLQPIEAGGTFVVSCGEYTQNLGKIVLTKSADGKPAVADYALIPIDNTIPADPGMLAMVEKFQGVVDKNYLSNYDMGYNEVLAVSQQDFTIPQIGDFIGLGYIDTVKKVEGAAYAPITFAVVPDGIIRDVIRAGDVTTSKAFNILSLGVGADGSPGYPLISLYLTGKDLKCAFEVDASVSTLMSGTNLYGAGCWWSVNPHRILLDRTSDGGLTGVGGGPAGVINDDQLYRVIADLYSGQMLGAVKSKSFGLLSVVPRDAQGNEITDFESCIIHDADGKEVKAWYALAAYLRSGAAVVPPEASRVDAPSWNPLKLFLPAGFTLIIAVVGLILIALIVFIIYRVATRRKRKAYKAYLRAKKGGWN